jgi:hypothetical protein
MHDHDLRQDPDPKLDDKPDPKPDSKPDPGQDPEHDPDSSTKKPDPFPNQILTQIQITTTRSSIYLTSKAKTNHNCKQFLANFLEVKLLANLICNRERKKHIKQNKIGSDFSNLPSTH